MNIRELQRAEIEKIWTINRGEVIENIYYFQNGNLILKPEHYNLHGWLPGEPEQYTPVLVDCFDRGGTFYGMFQNADLIGVAVLENKFIGKNKDQLQLTFLHISRTYRKRGIGKILFKKAVEKAREMNAQKLYVSATPSENTVNFYINVGCVVTQEIDQELFELEPEDIHLEYVIP
ncbi:MAG: GNAT family N-acetyltransferase [Candidatus Marinimicrobia bacterium]|nr:GNAT family N-acetyltransferase [Candidatus Neomarinimicrobiota bacterium]